MSYLKKNRITTVLSLVLIFFSCVLGICFFSFGVGIAVTVLAAIVCFVGKTIIMFAEQMKLIRIMTHDLDPEAFLGAIAPILAKVNTVENGLYTWRTLEADALSLSGNRKAALDLRYYLLNLKVLSSDRPSQNLMKGVFALSLLEEGRPAEAQAWMALMEQEADTFQGQWGEAFAEIRALWIMEARKDPTLFEQHCALVFSNPKSKPLSVIQCHFNLGEFYFRNGEKEKAREHLEYAAEKGPKLHLGRLAAEHLTQL